MYGTILIYTMQLKVFMQRKSINPIIDKTYNAKAGQRLQDILDKNNSMHLTRFFWAYQIFLAIFIILLFITMLFLSLSCNSAHFFKNLQKKTMLAFNFQENETLFISIAIISVLLSLYMFVLDMCAAITFQKLDKEELMIADKLQYVPTFVLLCNSFIFFAVVLSAINSCSTMFKNIFLDSLFFITFEIISTVIHLPFIVIAYLNDAYHAGSILIFYVVSFLILLAVIELSFYVMLKFLVSKELTIKNMDVEIVRAHSYLFINCESANSNRNEVELERFTLELEEANEVKVETAKLTACVDKVKKGTLNNVHIELAKPTEGCKTAKFCESARNNSVELEFELDLKNEILINTKAHKCTCMVQEQGGSKIIIDIPNAKLYNESVTLHIICSVISLVSLFVLTVAGIVLTAAYLVLIPINRSISDAPNRLIGVYHPLLLLVGVYIAYKAFFKKNISLKSIVEESKKSFSSTEDDDRWSLMSKEERLVEFYKTKAQMIMYQARQLSK